MITVVWRAAKCGDILLDVNDRPVGPLPVQLEQLVIVVRHKLVTVALLRRDRCQFLPVEFSNAHWVLNTICQIVGVLEAVLFLIIIMLILFGLLAFYLSPTYGLGGSTKGP